MKPNRILFDVFLYFCFLSWGNSLEIDSFYVEKSGHSKVRQGEIAVIFYMTVANSGASSKKIYSKNIKCCWTHPGSTSNFDCESMDLVGGMAVTLAPAKKANITYLFTNLYPLDRIGQCVFHLWYSNNKIAHTIRFNTTYLPNKDDTWLGHLYKTFVGDGKKVKVCKTMDLDPRRNCKPVSCAQKYNGKRNFFRKETNLCEPVYECYTHRDKEGLPTTAFDKDHNKCKSLIQKELTKDEERNLKEDAKRRLEASERAKFKIVGTNDPIPLKCNHGKRVGEICVCDNGWKTDTSNVPLGDPKFVYNWCNVRTRKQPWLPYKVQKRFMIVGLSLTSFTLFVAWLWMIHRHMHSSPEPPYETVHAWKETNLFGTSTLFRELAGRKILDKQQISQLGESDHLIAQGKDSESSRNKQFVALRESAKDLLVTPSFTPEQFEGINGSQGIPSLAISREASDESSITYSREATAREDIFMTLSQAFFGSGGLRKKLFSRSRQKLSSGRKSKQQVSSTSSLGSSSRLASTSRLSGTSRMTGTPSLLGSSLLAGGSIQAGPSGPSSVSAGRMSRLRHYSTSSSTASSSSRVVSPLASQNSVVSNQDTPSSSSRSQISKLRRSRAKSRGNTSHRHKDVNQDSSSDSFAPNELFLRPRRNAITCYDTLSSVLQQEQESLYTTLLSKEVQESLASLHADQPLQPSNAATPQSSEECNNADPKDALPSPGIEPAPVVLGDKSTTPVLKKSSHSD